MTNRKIRDTVFCRYIGTQSHLLELANALKGTQYTDTSMVNINTLEGSSFDHETLRLSDAFLAPSDQLELTVNVYNLADNKSNKLKSLCEPLHDYSIFSNKYKQFRRENLSIDEAVQAAINYCLENNIMSEYLKNNEREVIDMFGYEWNEQEERKSLLETGETKGIVSSIRNLMKNMNLSAEDAMKAIGIAPSQYKQYMTML